MIKTILYFKANLNWILFSFQPYTNNTKDLHWMIIFSRSMLYFQVDIYIVIEALTLTLTLIRKKINHSLLSFFFHIYYNSPWGLERNIFQIKHKTNGTSILDLAIWYSKHTTDRIELKLVIIKSWQYWYILDNFESNRIAFITKGKRYTARRLFVFIFPYHTKYRPHSIIIWNMTWKNTSKFRWVRQSLNSKPKHRLLLLILIIKRRLIIEWD